MNERKEVKRTPTRRTSSKKRTTRTTTARKTATKKAVKHSSKLNNETKGIITIAFGMFLALTFFVPKLTGVFGAFFKSTFMGFFGSAAYIFFVFIIWTGVNAFINRDGEKSTYKPWVMLFLMASCSVLMALAHSDTDYSYPSFWNALKSMFLWGRDGFGGGVIGSGICKFFAKFIGIAGSWIVSVTVTLILLIILTEISIEKLIRTIIAQVKAHKEKKSALEEEDEEFDDDDDDDEAEVGEQLEIPEEKPEKEKRSSRKSRKNESSEQLPHPEIVSDASTPNNDYFDMYFSSDDINTVIEDATGESMSFSGDEINAEAEETEDKPTDDGIDADILKNVPVTISGDDAEPMPISHDDAVPMGEIGHKTVTTPADAIDGILTQLPDEKGNFKENNDDDFEPPSLTQMQEKVDPKTQAAIDAGVPLDQVVLAGKRMTAEEVAAAANHVDNMAKESIDATKLLHYKLPPLSLLAKPSVKTKSRNQVRDELNIKAKKLIAALASFKVEATVLNVIQGPTVTSFELQPGFGVKVSKITNLADDIALSLAAPAVRIEAPIPGKSAIGIEIPNDEPSPVPIREVISSDSFKEFKSKTAFALGKDINGRCIISDVSKFPHVLIAGATGSGKSVCINSLITSILYKAKPNEVKMIMIDPKMVELGVYNGIPHLLIPVVTDPKQAAGALNWAVVEMKNRYKLLNTNKVRNVDGFNALMEENETPEQKLPEIIIIIDELADLMLAAKSEVENAINSLAALARAAGMYLVIATQRPSVDVVTGVIKANVPSRISFAVSSQIDSRTILDSPGAEKLLGKGDMLYAPRGATKPIRIQGNFVSDSEIEKIVDYIKQQYEADYDEDILEHIEKEQERASSDEEDTRTESSHDDIFIKAVELVLDSGQASVAMLQRKFKVGYQRAARMIDQMEEERIIGPYEGTKPRQVLITRSEFNEMLMNRQD